MLTRTLTVAVAVLAVLLLGGESLNAQAAFKRTMLQKHDLSTPDREVVQALASPAP